MEYEEATREAVDMDGVLRVAAPVTYGAMHLSDATANFLKRRPGMSVSVSVEVVLSDCYVDLLGGDADVAIKLGNLRDSDVAARQLASCRMVLCAFPRLLDRIGPLRTVAELRGAPRLVFSESVSAGDWTVTDPGGTSNLIDGQVRMASNNTQVLLAGTFQAQGVAYGPDFVFGNALATGGLVRLLPNHRTSDLAIQAVYAPGRHVAQKLRSFIDLLLASTAGMTG